ncbi:MAG: T9SS type A sorting domain-containing protein [Bacteroidota bacterium]
MTKRVLLWMLLVQMMSAQAQLWYQKQNGNIGPAMSVAVNAQGGIFVSVYNKGIYRSLDTGATWSQIAPFTDGVWSMAVRSSGEIVAALWSRGVYRSTDNGTSWTQTDSNKLHADVRAINHLDEIIIEAEGTLFRSTNNGAEWIQSTVGGTSVAVKGDTMFAAKGTSVFRSIDNGKNWTSLTSLSSSTYSLLADPSGSIFAGGYCSDTSAAPSIFSYNSEAQTWSGNGPRSTINALLRRNGGVLFAASHDSGFYFSTDHGAVWHQYNNGLSSKKIYSLALLNDTTIVAGTLDGIFFSTGPLSAILPVELTSFTASVRNSIVHLRWTTATEVNNFGFELQRRTAAHIRSAVPVQEEWSTLGLIEGAGTSNAPREYQYLDKLPESGVYEYRLKQIDRDGKIHFSSVIEVTAVTALQRFTLEQNFPNPFNPSTTISYSIPASEYVSLRVFDLLGREVSRLVNAIQNAGDYSVTLDASSLSSGMYLYTLRSGNASVTKRMMLVR